MQVFEIVVGIFTIAAAIANIVVMFRKTAEIRRIVNTLSADVNAKIVDSSVTHDGIAVSGGNATAKSIGRSEAKVKTVIGK